MSGEQAAVSAVPAWRQFGDWAARTRLANKLALGLSILAVLAGIATYVALGENPPFGHDPQTVYLLLNLDLAILLLLGAVIAHRIVGLWVKRRRGLAGSRLHVRLVALFSTLAVAPAIVLAVFSTLFFHLGIQSWFSERVSTAVNESLSVAQAYLSEHQQVLRADALAMANDLNREAPHLVRDATGFNHYVSTQALLRNLTEALVFDGTGRTLARSALTFSLQFETVPEAALANAQDGEVVLLPSETDDRVRALVRLDRFVDTYLLVGRLIEAGVIAHMQRTEGAVTQYQELEGAQSGLQITMTLIYIVITLLLLLGAVWGGLLIADTLVTPISALITAAERVRAGDLTARVATTDSGDELDSLSHAFNRMTSQLEGQRGELIDANEQLDQRRRFTETVLAGVSAGVIGLDAAARINLPNRSASELIGKSLESFIGRPLVEAVPEMADLLQESQSRPGRLVEAQVKVRRGAEPRTLLVRILAEQVGRNVSGHVVTFDDITELLSAQRKAAWADVARRIAHEIKNPLTPIQLSAERLKRRYLKQIQSSPEVFVNCTDTIIRQVGDIGRMVDEFSAFARMPSPVMKHADVMEICQQAVSLQRNAYSGITFTLTGPRGPRPTLACDARQVSQSLTNLLQNAIEAIEARPAPSSGRLPRGEIVVTVATEEQALVVCIDDNGRGLPEEDRDRLAEPYVTTRAKGTGLGLAIVKKIMEDHGGRLILEDRPGGGARAKLIFPWGGGAQAASAEAQDPRLQEIHGA